MPGDLYFNYAGNLVKRMLGKISSSQRCLAGPAESDGALLYAGKYPRPPWKALEYVVRLGVFASNKGSIIGKDAKSERCPD